MLTQEEKKFIAYWSVEREKKKSWWRQLSAGLPLGVMIVFMLFVNMLIGWHKKAAMIIRSNGSVIITVLIAAIGIVVFMALFARRYRREQYEQRYQELLVKQKNEDATL